MRQPDAAVVGRRYSGIGESYEKQIGEGAATPLRISKSNEASYYTKDNRTKD